jgi:hypothetical protein
MSVGPPRASPCSRLVLTVAPLEIWSPVADSRAASRDAARPGTTTNALLVTNISLLSQGNSSGRASGRPILCRDRYSGGQGGR